MERVLTEEEIKENRLLWIETLETTQLPQCRNRLHDGTGYCPLGLALGVLSGTKPVAGIDSAEEYKKLSSLLGLDTPRLLPYPTDGEEEEGTIEWFVQLNDSDYLSFKEIAQKAKQVWGY